MYQEGKIWTFLLGKAYVAGLNWKLEKMGGRNNFRKTVFI